MSTLKTREPCAGVIGGGLGGLAADCTLAARGHKVTLLEKDSWSGGKDAVLEERIVVDSLDHDQQAVAA